MEGDIMEFRVYIHIHGLVSCCWMSFHSHSIKFVAGSLSCNTNICSLGYGILENEWYYEGDITEFKVYIYTWPCVMLMDVMSFHSHSVEFVVGSLSCNTSIRFVGCRDIREWVMLWKLILWSLGCIYTLGLVSCCWMSFDSHSVGFVAGCMSCNTNIRPLGLWDTREWVILWGWYYGV